MRSEAITEEKLAELGFEYEDLGTEPPYDWFVHPSGLKVWEYNGLHWICDQLDQGGIDLELHTIGDLIDLAAGLKISLAKETAAAAEGENDSKRLAWFAQNSGFDGFGGIDIHEEASIAASVFAREEPNSDDYLFAMRNAIDAAMKEEGDAVTG